MRGGRVDGLMMDKWRDEWVQEPWRNGWLMDSGRMDDGWKNKRLKLP